MARFIPFFLLMVALVVATADPFWHSDWVPIPNIEKDGHVQDIGAFAVQRYNEKNRGYLKFVHVLDGQVLDRETGHYTYRLTIKVLDPHYVEFYKSEVLEDLSGPGQPPVLNFGYFLPL